MLHDTTTIGMIGAAAGLPLLFGCRWVWEGMAARFTRSKPCMTLSQESLEPATLIESALERALGSGTPANLMARLRTGHTRKLRGDSCWLVTAFADLLHHAVNHVASCDSLNIWCMDCEKDSQPYVLIRVAAHGSSIQRDQLKNALSTSTQIINAHLGRLTVAETGTLTEFSVMLPAAMSRSSYRPQWANATLATITAAPRRMQRMIS